jgi:hypothetical protein
MFPTFFIYFSPETKDSLLLLFRARENEIETSVSEMITKIENEDHAHYDEGKNLLYFDNDKAERRISVVMCWPFFSCVINISPPDARWDFCGFGYRTARRVRL